MVTGEDVNDLIIAINHMMQDPPAPPPGSAIYVKFEALLSIASAISKTLNTAAAAGVAPFGLPGLSTQFEQLKESVRLVDQQWAQESGRPQRQIVIRSEQGCGLLRPWNCFTAALGPVLGWAIFIGAAYYGGKLLYQYVDKKTSYPAKRLPRYAGGQRTSR